MLTDQATCNPVFDRHIAGIPAELSLDAVTVQVLGAKPVPYADDRALEQGEEAFAINCTWRRILPPNHS